MIDEIYLGCCPVDEEPSQSVDQDFREKNRAECERYRDLLVKLLGIPPKGATLYVKRQDHDFGPYREVVVRFDDAFPESVEYAFRLEAEGPRTWSG